jgi:hypothetical protein
MISFWGVEHGVVSKTFIPGKGYISASKLPKNEYRMINRNRKAATRRVANEEKKHFDQYRSDDKDLKNMLSDLATRGRQQDSPVKGVVYQEPDFFSGLQMKQQNMDAFAVKRGSRRHGPKVMVVPKNARPETMQHELGHLTPNRSGYRLWTITRDGNKIMREEARADMHTQRRGSYYKTDTHPDSGYVQAARDPFARGIHEANERRINAAQGRPFSGKFSEESMDNYRQVQDRIQGARERGNRMPFQGDSRNFRGNQYVDDKKQRRTSNARRTWNEINPRYKRIAAATGIGAGAGGGGYGAYRYNKRKKANQ